MTRRVLLVEDDADTARLASRLLRDEPYRLLWATSAADAVSLARLHEPDLIVLSWALPEMTGDQLADILSLYSETKDIPLVLFGLEPWLFAPRCREKAVQVVDKTHMASDLAPRLRDALGLQPSPLTAPAELERIRDRSLWWAGEEEMDWRPAKRSVASFLSALR